MRRIVAFLSIACACGCERPFLARDGTLVFSQKGAHGASVVTANGLEFHDVREVPQRVVVRDPYEPWRAPVGFLVPTSGRFTRTSTPTRLSEGGLSVSLRPSDSRVPSWGGEMLVRVDVVAPADDRSARWGEDVAVVIDGDGPQTSELCAAALAQLGARDRVVVVDSAGPRVVAPAMPASNRSLVAAAVERRIASPRRGRRDARGALAAALGGLSRAAERRVLMLSDSVDPIGDVAEAPGGAPVALAVVPTNASDDAERRTRVRAVQDFIPAAGASAFEDLTLAFEGTPAPSHVLEASGGDARWKLEGGELSLGDLRAGDARTEMVRVSVPAWSPGEAFTLHVTARFGDLSRHGERRGISADLSCIYDDDIERLAESRHGDVIAYASALATLARLDAAFLGRASSAPALRAVARMHARSLALLARDMNDAAAAAQAAMLDALLGVDFDE